MTGNIIGEPFDDFVYKEIGYRQSNQFSGYNDERTQNQIQYLNNQNSWIKLASSVSISGSALGQDRVKELLTDSNKSLFEGTSLAKKSILFGGLSSQIDGENNEFNYYIQRSGLYTGKNIWNQSYAYGLGNKNQGIQPMPGIVDLTIDCQNRGSIRKATLNIKAYNKFQFELIELLYLRIGFTMMLEWGNSRYIDPKTQKLTPIRNTIIEDIWFKENGTTQLDMLTSIIKYRKTYSSNYDGFMGKVTNFNWSFQPDGSYDIKLDLITIGDIIESLQVNLPLTERIVVEELKGGKSNEESTPINEIENVVEYYLFSSKQDKEKKLEQNPNYLNLQTKYTEKEAFNIAETIKVKPEFNYYVTLGEFLNQLGNLILPNIKSLGGSESAPILQFDTDEETNLISYGINQTPLDPRVCLFKFSFSGESVKGLSTPSFTKSMKDYTLSLGNVTAGKLMNLYLNFNFIEKCLKQNLDKENKLSLFNFLSSLCDGINVSLGGINKLEPIIKDDYIITILDQTPIYGLVEELNKSNIVPLEIYGYNLESNSSNFVKNISLNTSITPDLASMVSIGATAAGNNVKGIDATSFSKWNAGLVDRFNKEVNIPDIDPKILEKQQEEQQLEKYKKEWDETATVETIANKTWALLKLAASSLGNPGSFVSQGVQNRLEDKKRAEDPSTTKTFVSNPSTGKPAGTFTRDEFAKVYLENYKRIQQQKKNKLDQETKIKSNYLLYLVDAFGGNKVLIEDNEPVTRDIKNSQFLYFDSKFISRGQNSYKEYLRIINEEARKKSEEEAKKLKDIFSSNQIGFIPINLQITLQGISGVKIYNKLSINQKFLPKNYPESLHFIVTKVNHVLKENQWETTLSTLSIPVTKEQNLKLEAPIYTTDNPEDYLIEGPIPPTPTSGNRFLIIENRNIDETTGRRTELLRNQQPQNYAPPGSIIGINKVLEDINPNAKEDFRGFLTSLEENYPGYKMILNATGRSFTKSEALREQNNKNALPGLSKHNYYAAIDFNIIDPNGVIYKKENFRVEWIKSGIPKLAENYNIGWGGNFSNYEDCIHFYYNFDINTAYQNALLSPEFRQTGDIANVDGYKVPLS